MYFRNYFVKAELEAGLKQNYRHSITTFPIICRSSLVQHTEFLSCFAHKNSKYRARSWFDLKCQSPVIIDN